jgi:hypothetical protein
VAGSGRRLAAVGVDEEGGRGAHGFEEDAGKVGERLQAFGVADVGLIERLDEELAEEFGDVDVIEEAREAAGAAAGRGAAFAAGLGQGLLVIGAVEEAEVAARERVSGAGGAVGFDEGAAGVGHGQASSRSGVQAFRAGKGRARARCTGAGA